MSWRISISHTTTHGYAEEVIRSYNEARLTPRTLPGQVCLASRIDVEPRTHLTRYFDYWGTTVDSFDIHTPHTVLKVDSRATVETNDQPMDDPGIGWEELAESVSEEFAELLAPTRFVPEFPHEAEMVRDLAPATPLEAARTAADWVRDRLNYEIGATDVTTAADMALARGKGVCQDFAHLTLGILRSMGIPGRYVSGYLYPLEDGPLGEPQAGQGHAWVEWWCGTWMPWDPTHGQAVGTRHVTVGRGRDYADVTPLKGIYQGAASVAPEVRVTITRLA